MTSRSLGAGAAIATLGGATLTTTHLMMLWACVVRNRPCCRPTLQRRAPHLNVVALQKGCRCCWPRRRDSGQGCSATRRGSAWPRGGHHPSPLTFLLAWGQATEAASTNAE